jgi:hypothetical protein
MHVRKTIYSVGFGIVAASALTALVHAGSATAGGITLAWPEYPVTGSGFMSCEPWQESQVNTITLTGVPVGSNVTIQFMSAPVFSGTATYATPISIANVTSGSLVVPVIYPQTNIWPVWDAATNTKAIAAAVAVHVTSGSTSTKLSSKKWWIKCGSVPPPPAQGCGLGFWKADADHHGAVNWPGTYTTGANYNAVFGVTASFSASTTLSDALGLGGGGQNALARHAVAALLNAASPEVAYPISESNVVSIVQTAYATNTAAAFTSAKNELELLNEGSGPTTNCPLNHGDDD